MPAPEPYWVFIERFEAAGLPYCITGSVAAAIYGEILACAEVDDDFLRTQVQRLGLGEQWNLRQPR